MKKFKYLFICCLVLGTTSSCVKDYKSSTATYIDNTTNYTVMVFSYQNGVVDYGGGYVEIGSHEKKLVFEKNVWGKTLSPCWGVLLQPYDSVVVVFDDTYRSVHLRFNDTLTVKAHIIPFTNNRNITNPDNYEMTITKNHKKYENGYYSYTVTEQDYQFARN